MKKKSGLFPRILNSEIKCPKKWYFLLYESAIYRIKSKVAYLGQFFADLNEIWYKSRATQGDLTHQISSWSDEKWQRYGTWSVSQGRRGPSNGVSKMNLFMAGGHSFWPRKLIFRYFVGQSIYPKSYYYPFLLNHRFGHGKASKMTNLVQNTGFYCIGVSQAWFWRGLFAENFDYPVFSIPCLT